MTYNVKPLACDPQKLKGLSERRASTSALLCLRDQRAEARRTDRDEFHDPP